MQNERMTSEFHTRFFLIEYTNPGKFSHIKLGSSWLKKKKKNLTSPHFRSADLSILLFTLTVKYTFKKDNWN